MKIQITDKYSIESEPLNFVIYRHSVSKKGRPTKISVGYFPELSQVIRRIVQLDLMGADISGVLAVQDRLTALSAKIEACLDGIKRTAI